MESSPALFLDRDGVINIDHGYVCRKEEFEFVEGIFELVAAAKRAGYLVVVVTNQAGIGRGYYTEADFNRLMEWVAEQFAERGGGIDKVYYCPDHPEHGIGNYKRHSEFRKPGPGMILQAAAELHIDLGRSLLVGDKPSDIQAGLEAGIGTLLKLGAEPGLDSAKMISSVSEAINYL
ncbi:MAG: D-glycero-alpha-D-manno-heptose-1,7-bisphosphate 7-phosphatase [Gammaproteobacteria bacterium]